MNLGVLKNSTAYPYLFLLDFSRLIQYTSENLTFKGSPERLTRCQRKETTIETSKQVLICYFCVNILTETLQCKVFLYLIPLKFKEEKL